MLPRANLRLVILKVAHALSVKSVQSFATDYRVKLSELVADNLNGDIDAGTQARRHRTLINDVATETYVEGLFESGEYKTRSEAEADLDETDNERIGEWIAEQNKFVGQFARDVTAARLKDDRTDAENEAAQLAVLSRVDMWGNALATLGDFGRAAGHGNKMVTWKLGPTEKHCESKDGNLGCAELDGKRHKVKWFTSQNYIPRKPGARQTCGGYNCQCELVNDKGERVL